MTGERAGGLAGWLLSGRAQRASWPPPARPVETMKGLIDFLQPAAARLRANEGAQASANEKRKRPGGREQKAPGRPAQLAAAAAAAKEVAIGAPAREGRPRRQLARVRAQPFRGGRLTLIRSPAKPVGRAKG